MGIEHEDKGDWDEHLDEHLHLTLEEEAEEGDQGPRGGDLQQPKGYPLGGLLTAKYGADEWQQEASQKDERRQQYDEKH